jgi:hypothetical protein
MSREKGIEVKKAKGSRAKAKGTDQVLKKEHPDNIRL